jgi:para-aminobenzoate synthetase component 1
MLELPRDDRPPTALLPPLWFAVHTWALAVDPQGQGWVVAPAAQLDDLRRFARYHAGLPPVPSSPPAAVARPGLTREQHAAAVTRILEWIAAGDLYQANLTFQIRTPWDGSAAALARALWHATPGAAHAALLTIDDQAAVVSASPETFLRTDGDRVVTRPIKGTRRRSPDPEADEVAAAALRSSVKDHAEHVMIVDLERNDLGRVCVPGSVVVESYAELEQLPTVWHLTSTVAGRLRADVGLADLLRATFPPGSVTGTPKRMAVARTRLVEPVRRGVYCGAIGLVGPGLLDLSVAIRTAVVSGGVASYGAGGAIVADSDPAEEYDEALAKAAAFLTATGASLG